MTAVTDDVSQQQKQVIDLLDDDGDDDEKPSHQETNIKPVNKKQTKNTKKQSIKEGNKDATSDLIDLSGPAEPKSNSVAQLECIDLSQINEPVTNSNEVIVID